MANLVTCEGLPASLKAAIQSMSEEDRKLLGSLIQSGIDIDSLISNEQGNAIVSKTGKLYADGRPSSMVSKLQSNNAIRIDAEGKLYVTNLIPADVISSDEDNALHLGNDQRLHVDFVDPAELISEDANNALKIGSDGKLFIEKQ